MKAYLLSTAVACLLIQAQFAMAAKNKEIIPAAVDANAEFTPLILKESSPERGISLSGQTELQELKKGHYKLSCGCALIHTEEDVFIETCRAKIYARKGASIVIGAKTDVTRVLNLSDRKHDSLRVVFEKNHISLNPGEELAVVSSTASNADKAANEYVIRYRNAQTIGVSPKYKAVLFEFSLSDAMRHCLIFKQLTESPRPADKELLKEIIKTAAAVNTMFSKSRPEYKRESEQAFVALNVDRKTRNKISLRRKSTAIAEQTLSKKNEQL
ncbi:MAG: hypothetical protein K2X27_19225 [Candidatus Obscuribacterales bacterium]|nr:hypothetical protein [Candidatus Obscuribacterales bacterium]